MPIGDFPTCPRCGRILTAGEIHICPDGLSLATDEIRVVGYPRDIAPCPHDKKHSTRKTRRLDLPEVRPGVVATRKRVRPLQ